MYYLILILIIINIILINKNNHLSNENAKLENKLQKKINFCPNCGYELSRTKLSQPQNNIPPPNNIKMHEEINNDYQIKEVKTKYTEKEIKNSLILIVGSVLIILSALLFLTTTWDITHNIFKTFVIILMLIVFLAASYIADQYLHLKETSKAFYYIALAYLPIIFLAIALFSLFGKYFSLYGLGKYIYLGISSIIITFIYYFNAIKKNSKLIGIASSIFSILSILFLTLIFTKEISICILILSLYAE